MKKISTTIAMVLLCAGSLFAQAPQKFAYQAVLRDAGGSVLIRKGVALELSILRGAEDGTPVYTEKHSATTTANGVVNLQLGAGETSDDFSLIDWKYGPYFVHADAVVNGEKISLTSQLLSVPYALYAEKVNEDNIRDFVNQQISEMFNADSLKAVIDSRIPQQMSADSLLSVIDSRIPAQMSADSLLSVIDSRIPAQMSADSLLSVIDSRIPAQMSADSLLSVIDSRIPAQMSADSLLSVIDSRIPAQMSADSLLSVIDSRIPAQMSADSLLSVIDSRIPAQMSADSLLSVIDSRIPAQMSADSLLSVIDSRIPAQMSADSLRSAIDSRVAELINMDSLRAFVDERIDTKKKIEKEEEGLLPGKFSCSEAYYCRFAKGNLQYQASTDTWRLAEHQYDVIPKEENQKASETYSGWIDVFAWGTSGYNGLVPYMRSQRETDYLTDYFHYADMETDWGYHNAISNGGGAVHMWETINVWDWFNVIWSRDNCENLASMGFVNNVEGLIVLPDDWKLPEGLTFTPVAEYSQSGVSRPNDYSKEQWALMEANGAVFLPGYCYWNSPCELSWSEWDWYDEDTNTGGVDIMGITGQGMSFGWGESFRYGVPWDVSVMACCPVRLVKCFHK